MKLIRKRNTNKIYAIALLLALFVSGCEGLDDWSELQNIDLFDNKTAADESTIFKRYAEPGMSSQPLVQYIVDESAKYSKIYSNEIRKACDYTKLPFNTISLKTWNNSLAIAPTTRVLCVYETKKLNDASVAKLIDFVANGGTLFIPFASEDRRMAFLLGFKTDAEYATDIKSKGWYFNYPMLPSLKVKTYSTNVSLFGFAAENFSNKIKILATAVNNAKFPSIVENPIGKGRVILYNTSDEFLKCDRGFLFAAVLKGLEGIPYPIANTATIFLDDFPAPQYAAKVEPIASEMTLNMSDFVNSVWWPDMKKLAKEFKIPYTAMTTFDYRNKIVPPFTLDQWNAQKITINNKTEPLTDWLVRDAAKNGSELAFHGYNHVSLMTNLWKNQQFIATSLNTVKKKWEISNFGTLPTTYVPPSNEIDKKGIIELKKAMPSLKYLCSLYLGQLTDGGDREFDYDPYEKNFFDYPRISSGFYLSDDRKYNLHSMYLITGIWTHFVHPDDVFQIPNKNTEKKDIDDLRNGENLGWYHTKGKTKAMFPEFRNILKQMTNTYPQLRFMKANDAAKIVIDWRASRYSHKSENGFYKVDEINPPHDTKQYWFMFGSTANATRIEARLKSQTVLFSKTPFMDGYLYSAYTNKPKLSVIDLNYKSPKEKAIQLKVNQQVRADYAKYAEAAKRFLSGAVWIDDSDKILKAEMAALRTKMLNTAVIDSVTWNRYAKKMSWADRAEEVWKMLEDHVTKFPSRENVMYSKELDRIIGYPNDLVKEKWMSAQLLVTPNDKDLLNSYVANFYTDENQEKIQKALKALLSVDTSAKSYKNYIKHLLQYKPEEARLELSDKKPSEELAEFATQIVWLFADNNEYQKAYDWSALSKDIDFVTKMNWLIEMRQYKLLDQEFLKYIAENPDDYKAKALMSSVYHEMTRFKDSWILANSLPESADKEALRKILNKDVIFENEPLQQDLIANHAALFYPNVLKSLVKEDRLKKGNYINLLSSLETNQANNALQKNEFSYNVYDKKFNLHSIAATYNQYYKQKLIQNYDNNFDNTLMGIQYKFTTAEKEGKSQYWSRARVEFDKSAKAYYQFGIGLTSSKAKRFRSGELILFPVATAPGLNQGIYQVRLNLYQDFYLFKIINTSISFEADYYTDGLLTIDTIKNTPVINPNRFDRKVFTTIDADSYTISEFDDAYGGALTLRFMLDKGLEKKSKFIPFLETQYSMGSKDLAVGYPYWMIKSRMYEGGGLAWKLKLTNLETKIEGSYFFDDYSNNFQRYSGNISYQLFDFTALTANVEIFSQSKFYSNSVQLGVKYNLKKRIKTRRK
ncbi:MAG: DUF2194 domain-containing protein [Burkholderiales bacterium]|nr:DUF2194 domain-containing protein [Flavobacterium sp.]